MTIEERFEKIEKKNEDLEKQTQALKDQARRLRRLAWGAVAIALAAFVGGTALSVRAYTGAIEPTSITTTSITLKDSSNRPRLFLTGNSGTVSALDANGKWRASLDSSGIVTVGDENGVIRAIMSSSGKIYFRNASGQSVAEFGPSGITPTITTPTITTQKITLIDASGRTRLILDGASGSVAAIDGNGKARVGMDSAGFIYVRDANGNPRAYMNSEGRINAHDSNGVPRVSMNGSDNKIYFRNSGNQTVGSYPQ